MALDGDALGTQINNALNAFQGQAPPENEAEMEQRQEDWCKALGGAIVDYITVNAEISTNVSTAVTTTGTATAQAGTGTGAGTGTIS